MKAAGRRLFGYECRFRGRAQVLLSPWDYLASGVRKPFFDF